MPIILLWPIGLLALALLSDQSYSRAPTSQNKSIEACTAVCQASWIKEDGVVKVYSEQISVNCARIVVEVDPGQGDPSLPGEVDGHPVLIRLKSKN